VVSAALARSIGIVLRLLVCLLLSASAIAADVAEVLARLTAASRDLATLRVGFTQEKILALFDEPVVSHGTIEISRPLAAVRWEYVGKSLLILSGDRVRRWGADGVEESTGGDDPATAALRGQMRALLTGDWTALDGLFALAALPGDQPGLRLTPKDPGLSKYIAAIELVFRADFAAPVSLVLTSADGDATRYAFADPERDVALPAARFAGP